MNQYDFLHFTIKQEMNWYVSFILHIYSFTLNKNTNYRVLSFCIKKKTIQYVSMVLRKTRKRIGAFLWFYKKKIQYISMVLSKKRNELVRFCHFT